MTATEYTPFDRGYYAGQIARDYDIHAKGGRIHSDRTPELVRQAEVHEDPFWSEQNFINAVEGYIAGYLGDTPLH